MSQTTPDSPMENPHSPPTDSHGYATKPYEMEGMPPGIPYIIGNEAAERFSFYGMKTILVIFMTQYLLNSQGAPAFMDETESKEWYHNFVAAVYFLPIFGAIIADWLFGKYPTIMVLSIVYCLGHGVLALMDSSVVEGIEPRTLLFWGLALISVGSGGIKPCVSSHVGDQFGKKNQHLVSKVYSWFYFSINFGSFFSTLLTPFLLDKVGPGWAFGVPGILMAIATFMFWLGRHQYVHVPAGGSKFFEETFSKEGLSAIANLIPLYLLIVMFWALFDQTGSAWVLQAEDMNRVVDFGFNIPYLTNSQGEWEVLSSQLQAMNPALVMVLIPVFSYGLYPFLNRFIAVTPLRKIGAGLFITTLAFLITGLVEVWIEQGLKPHVIWHLLAYIVITAAEVMVSITTLEFSYTQAPKKMKSFIQGLYLMSVAFGNYFTAYVNGVISDLQDAGNPLMDGANYYWFFAACMLMTAIIFLIWSPFYRGKYILQDTTETAT
ncbi:POT family MFS transporter [Lacunimicrobium album]